ncbi:response regulator transcription factor [Advenella sp. RU8]|uniref:response regulator transcription factor n=1 Tax=Advenella sp. RU8 TaxID=3399575 RepID=UPI003AAC7774
MDHSNPVLVQKLARLTPREKEVLKLLGKGLPNKVVAAMLGVTERTIEAHRAHIFRKMNARNLVHLLYGLTTLELL